MMKIMGLVLGLLVIVSGAAFAASTTVDLYGPGWNMVTAPIVPFDPNPDTVFAGVPLVFPRLQRFDAIGQSVVQYDPDDPEGSGFGNVLLGDGFMVYCDGVTSYTYTGVESGVPDGAGARTDMWISLPGQVEAPANTDGGGFHLIGCPYEQDVTLDKISFTDGSSMLSWEAANAAGWVSDKLQYLVADGQSTGFLYYDGSGDDDQMRGMRGYWCQTFKDNLAMVITAP